MRNLPTANGKEQHLCQKYTAKSEEILMQKHRSRPEGVVTYGEREGAALVRKICRF